MATYYVSKSGNDTTGNGSAGSPWLTIQRGVNSLVAGDTLTVGAGTYYEDVRFGTSGTSGSRITVQGTRGVNNEWLTIIDGGVTLLPTNWVLATDSYVDYGGTTRSLSGTGAYKIACPTWVGPISGLTLHPSALCVADRPLWKIYEGYCDGGLRTVDGNNYNMYDMLAFSPTKNTGILPTTMKVWDGVEAFWAAKGSYLYIRYRNGDNPNSKGDIRVGPGGYRNGNTSVYQDYAPLNIYNKSYITMQDLRVQGGATAVAVAGNSVGNIVRRCDLRAQDANIHIFQPGNQDLNLGPHDTIIQYNLIHGDVLGYDTYPPVAMWYMGGDGSDLPRSVAYLQYRWNKYWVQDGDESSRAITNYYGINTQVLNNEIYDKSTAIIARGSMTISGNVIHNFNGGCALYFSGDSAYPNSTYYVNDNLFYEGGANPMRTNDIGLNAAANTTIYFYRNKIYNPSVHGGLNTGWWTSFTGGSTPAQRLDSQLKYFNYHNTYVGGAYMWGLNLPYPSTETVPYALHLNNIIQSTRNTFYPFYGNSGALVGALAGPAGMAGFSYNWNYGPVNSCTWIQGPNFSNQPAKLFNDTVLPTDWTPPVGSNVIAAGLDISQPFTINGVVYPALPGFSPGYFSGAAPDIGAVQTSVAPPTPPPGTVWVATDDFDSYTSLGQNLAGMNGGTGWTGAWLQDPFSRTANDTNFTIETAPAGMSGKAARSSGTGDAFYYRSFSSLAAGDFQIAVILTATPNAPVEVGLLTGSTTVGIIRFDTDLNLKIENMGTAVFNTFDTYSPSPGATTAIALEVQFDAAIQPNKYRARRDGRTWSDWTVAQSFTSVDTLYIRDSTTNAMDMWIDSIGVPVLPPVGTIILANPLAGQRYQRPDPVTIAWNSTGLTGNVTLQYSLDGGGFWYTIATVAYDSSPYSWAAAVPKSNQVKVRVSQGSISATSGTFKISGRR